MIIIRTTPNDPDLGAASLNRCKRRSAVYFDRSREMQTVPDSQTGNGWFLPVDRAEMQSAC